MSSKFLLSVIFSGLFACSSKRHDPISPNPSPRLQELKEMYSDMLIEAETIRDPINGWITPDDCDGMLWTGKYAASHDVQGVDIEAAEFESGRFGRRPIRCWEPNRENNESSSTWSRDMAMGLFIYAYKKDRLALLERHAKYGRHNNWIMGQPVGDLRVIYTPAVIGVLYQIIYALGGKDDPKRFWPNIYPSGLDDYQAHIQMLGIWLRCAVNGTPHGDISDIMFKRIKEHANREPYNPFYQYMLGLFTGNMELAIDLLLDPSEPVGSYVRCGIEKRRCILAERVFAASMTIQWLEFQELSKGVRTWQQQTMKRYKST